jgi:hypothetical protein
MSVESRKPKNEMDKHSASDHLRSAHARLWFEWGEVQGRGIPSPANFFRSPG